MFSRLLYVAVNSGGKILCGKKGAVKWLSPEDIKPSTHINTFCSLKRAKSELELKLSGRALGDNLIKIVPVYETFDFGFINTSGRVNP